MTTEKQADDLLKSLREDKVKVLSKGEEYSFFNLNGVDYISFVEDSYAHTVFNDAISSVYGYNAINPRSVYSINALIGNVNKLAERMKRAQSQILTHTFYAEARAVLDILRKAEERMAADRQKRFDDGVTSFDDLPFLFSEGERVTWLNGDDIQVGGYFKSAAIKNTWMGSYISVTAEVIAKIGATPTRAMVTTTIGSFAGTMEIDKLPVKRLVSGSKTEQTLIERGEIFASVSTGAVYYDYTGLLVKPSYWSDAEFRADGRVMIDPESMARIDSTNFNNTKRRVISRSHDDDETEIKIEKIDEKDLFACSPYVLGFSFRAKAWGLMRVAGLKPIAWAKDSFEQLVLDPKTKKRVRALVQNSSDSFSDIIGGKGGGCVFLLHGEPGQGKTLTAETVAEDLRRPLYSISVGELGTNPDQLEARLREILDLATVWNAVLLLDEADIFLEARDEKDVLRNAMVGVFLRLLEYHQGVLFLTTNRVRNIDTAFYSRISVAIAFGKADHDKREKMWTNLLGAAGISIPKEAILPLSSADLNGRQIKNVIRTAATMARLDGEPVTVERLVDEIQEATRFQRDMIDAPEVLTKQPALKAVA